MAWGNQGRPAQFAPQQGWGGGMPPPGSGGIGGMPPPPGPVSYASQGVRSNSQGAPQGPAGPRKGMPANAIHGNVEQWPPPGPGQGNPAYGVGAKAEMWPTPGPGQGQQQGGGMPAPPGFGAPPPSSAGSFMPPDRWGMSMPPPSSSAVPGVGVGVTTHSVTSAMNITRRSIGAPSTGMPQPPGASMPSVAGRGPPPGPVGIQRTGAVTTIAGVGNPEMWPPPPPGQGGVPMAEGAHKAGEHSPVARSSQGASAPMMMPLPAPSPSPAVVTPAPAAAAAVAYAAPLPMVEVAYASPPQQTVDNLEELKRLQKRVEELEQVDNSEELKRLQKRVEELEQANDELMDSGGPNHVCPQVDTQELDRLRVRTNELEQGNLRCNTEVGRSTEENTKLVQENTKLVHELELAAQETLRLVNELASAKQAHSELESNVGSLKASHEESSQFATMLAAAKQDSVELDQSLQTATQETERLRQSEEEVQSSLRDSEEALTRERDRSEELIRELEAMKAANALASAAGSAQRGGDSDEEENGRKKISFAPKSLRTAQSEYWDGGSSSGSARNSVADESTGEVTELKSLLAQRDRELKVMATARRRSAEESSKAASAFRQKMLQLEAAVAATPSASSRASSPRGSPGSPRHPHRDPGIDAAVQFPTPRSSATRASVASQDLDKKEGPANWGGAHRGDNQDAASQAAAFVQTHTGKPASGFAAELSPETFGRASVDVLDVDIMSQVEADEARKPAPPDRRIDAEDCLEYTLEELMALGEGTYTDEEIQRYWSSMQPVKDRKSVARLDADRQERRTLLANLDAAGVETIQNDSVTAPDVPSPTRALELGRGSIPRRQTELVRFTAPPPEEEVEDIWDPEHLKRVTEELCLKHDMQHNGYIAWKTGEVKQFLDEFFERHDFPPPKIPMAIFSSIYRQVQLEADYDHEGLRPQEMAIFARRVHDFVYTSMKKEMETQRRHSMGVRVSTALWRKSVNDRNSRSAGTVEEVLEAAHRGGGTASSSS